MENNVIKTEETNNTKGKKILKNYIFNLIYQVFLLIVPLITTPYISRVLSPEGVGAYSFSFSIITYFTLASGLGVAMYAQREIAKYQGDRFKQSKLFWEVFILRAISSLICIIVNIILYSCKIYGEYSKLMLILTINIISIVFEISFLLQGNEKFASVAVRNAIIKIIGVASIFLFVKNKSDLWIYVLINSGIVLFSALSLWFNIHKYIGLIAIKNLRPFSHVKSVMLLFLPTIVVSIYTVLDKTLIGLILKSDSDKGFYEQAERIVKMCITVITCISTVMMSRNSAEYANGNFEQVKKNVYFCSKFVWFLATPIMFGIICISKNMNFWFFGESYEPVIELMIVFSPIVLALGFNNVFGVQYLITIGKDKQFTFSVIVGAVLNVVLNILLLKTIGTVGAVISSVLSETLILIIQLFIVRKDFSILQLFALGWKNILGSIVMFFIVYFSFINFESSIINSLIICITGLLVYMIMMLILKDELLFKMFNICKTHFEKKK